MTIFIVDDDKLHHFGMKRMLHHVKVATRIEAFYNGLQAIEFLQLNAKQTHLLPDIIFLDINMPVMDGWQFLDSFGHLELQSAKPISIYMVTSSADHNEVIRASSYKQVNSFILKPISIQFLEDMFKHFRS